MNTRMARIRKELVDLIDRDAKKNEIKFTEASRNLAEEVMNARLLAEKLGVNLKHKINRYPIWVFKK